MANRQVQIDEVATHALENPRGGVKLFLSGKAKTLKLSTVSPGWCSDENRKATTVLEGARSGSLTIGSVQALDELIALLDGPVRETVRTQFKSKKKKSKKKGKKKKGNRKSAEPELSPEEELKLLAQSFKLSSRGDCERFLSNPAIADISKKGHKAGRNPGSADFEKLKKWARKAKESILAQ